MIAQKVLHRWPKAVKSQVNELRERGLTIKEIVDATGVPTGTVQHWFYERDGAEEYRAAKRTMRPSLLYLGRIERCPAHGGVGYVQLRWIKNVETGHPTYFWIVQHNPGQIGNAKKVLDVVRIGDWDGSGIAFVSTGRERKFRRLVA
ncbi:MAG TPA: hypothetical protein VEO18_05965 [Thermoplasmata archaeon]|nr:hypothetical protein [Thermoplasmata archaeon]